MPSVANKNQNPVKNEKIIRGSASKPRLKLNPAAFKVPIPNVLTNFEKFFLLDSKHPFTVNVSNPNSFLKTVRSCLKENGKIFIDVPNLKEIIKLGGFGLFFHQHVTYFTIKTLSILLSKNGFKIQNYFEGKPNLFVEAIKTKNKSEKFENVFNYSHLHT